MGAVLATNRLHIDASGDPIVVTGQGFFTRGEVAAHFESLEDVLARRRARAEVRVLVDLSAAAVQARDVSEAIAEAARRVYAPGDRVAIIGHSMLQLMQLRRIHPERRFGLFLTVAEALAFLA